MSRLRKIDRPAILEIDIAGESLVLGIANLKDASTIFSILEENGYQITMTAVSKGETNTNGTSSV